MVSDVPAEYHHNMMLLSMLQSGVGFSALKASIHNGDHYRQAVQLLFLLTTELALKWLIITYKLQSRNFLSGHGDVILSPLP